MKKFLSSALIAGAMTLAATPATAATTLTFSSACGGLCTDGDNISQSYGDIAGILNMSYRSVTSNGSTMTLPNANNARIWSTGYGDLVDTVWGGEGGALEIAFNLLDPNKKITLNSVDYAGYGGNVATQLALYSFSSAGGFYLPLLASGAVTAPGVGHSTWSPNYTSNNGFILHFGPDGYLGGIGGLSFTISDINAVTPVPEAATWLSMILGFGVVGAAMRRRSSLRSAVAIV